jgi:hypothetical protein
MSAPSMSHEVLLMRLGGASALVIPIAMLLGVASLATVSGVAVPVKDPQAYLADLSTSQGWITVAPWFIGAIPLCSLFMWLGFYTAFNHSALAATRIAVLFGVVAAALELAVAGLAGVLVSHIAPTWAAAADEPLRQVIEADFLLVQWGFDVSLAAFDVFLSIAQIAAGIVMLAQRRRLWTIIGWVGMASGVSNLVGAFWFAAEPLIVVGVLGFFIGIPWVLGIGVGLLREPEPSHLA